MGGVIIAVGVYSLVVFLAGLGLRPLKPSFRNMRPQDYWSRVILAGFLIGIGVLFAILIYLELSTDPNPYPLPQGSPHTSA